ncbi:hypothetical protein CAPTEDRAFT_225238 [Capitella teleta]|uniref:Apple domain-containing protein n=1 Tax=Capitella teleta TaxID=283909 RepID=R7UGQ0_CAPTE|nr:hypothetical protein CAPTEDRAFT_225238 [Capitella teleta]|eukprot:ELU05400.1 hypothetical protein CAPTEDRAFT_225238 [Capitella teleta]
MMTWRLLWWITAAVGSANGFDHVVAYLDAEGYVHIDDWGMGYAYNWLQPIEGDYYGNPNTISVVIMTDDSGIGAMLVSISDRVLSGAGHWTCAKGEIPPSEQLDAVWPAAVEVGPNGCCKYGAFLGRPFTRVPLNTKWVTQQTPDTSCTFFTCRVKLPPRAFKHTHYKLVAGGSPFLSGDGSHVFPSSSLAQCAVTCVDIGGCLCVRGEIQYKWICSRGRSACCSYFYLPSSGQCHISRSVTPVVSPMYAGISSDYFTVDPR